MEGQPDLSYTSSVLPFSADREGNVSFDTNAGIIGSFKRAFMLPGDVYAGKVDPGSEEGLGRAIEFAGAFSPMNPAVRAGEAIVPGAAGTLRRAEVKPPSAERLSEAAAMEYDKLRSMGVDYSSSAVQGLARDLQSGLEQDGVIAELAPKTFSILGKLQAAPKGSVAPLSGLEAARRTFGNAAADFANPTEQLAAQRAREALAEFISKPDPAAVVGGNADDAAKVIQNARGNYAASKRSERLSGIQDEGELRAAAANSGQNSGNSTRQRIVSLLLNKKKSAGFNDEEIAALRSVAEGSAAANTSRYVGNLLGGGGGLGAATTGFMGASAGAMSGSPGMAVAGAALPLLGAASKKFSNSLTERALAEADALTRQRSPLYRDMAENAPMEAQTSPGVQAVLRALLLSQQAQDGGGGW